MEENNENIIPILVWHWHIGAETLRFPTKPQPLEAACVCCSSSLLSVGGPGQEQVCSLASSSSGSHRRFRERGYRSRTDHAVFSRDTVTPAPLKHQPLIHSASPSTCLCQLPQICLIPSISFLFVKFLETCWCKTVLESHVLFPNTACDTDRSKGGMNQKQQQLRLIKWRAQEQVKPKIWDPYPPTTPVELVMNPFFRSQ